MRLRYWLKSALALIGGSIGGAALYTVLAISTQTEPLFDDKISTALVFLTVFSGIMALLYNHYVYSQFLPIALSFGSTRKEAMIGIRIYRLLPGVVISILAAALSVFISSETVTVPLLAGSLSLFVIMFFGTWGAFIAMAGVRYGGNAAIIVLVAGLLLLGGAGAVIFITALSDNVDAIFESFVSNPLLPWVLILVSMILYGVILIPEKKAIYAYSVKL